MNSLVSQLTAVMNASHHPVFHSAARPGDVRRHCGDVTRLKELTGFEPRTISTETLTETAEWYRSVMQK